jgi:hypothetical protein
MNVVDVMIKLSPYGQETDYIGYEGTFLYR